MARAQSQATIFNLIVEDPLINRCETIRKSSSNSITEGMIPIPIQNFLWRQSDPFIKKRFGDLTNTSALNFKRIFVQNISHGLSPSLTDAIDSIPRSLFIQVAFPHVMRACSSIIEYNIRLNEATLTRNIRASHLPSISSSVSTHMPMSISLHLPASPYFLFSTPISSERPSDQSTLFPRLSSTMNSNLTTCEIHLFHTLHHLIFHLNDNVHHHHQQQQFLSLNLIELFIYLFVPHVENYFHKNEKEFLSNVDLVHGMNSIWQPLFEHRQPNIRLFNSFVKPNIFSVDYSHSFHPATTTVKKLSRSTSEKHSLSYLNDLSSQTLTNNNNERVQSSTEFFVESESIHDFRSTDAPIVDMNSICSVTDLHRNETGRYGLSLSVSAPSMTINETNSNRSILSATTLKGRLASNSILYATFFDVGIVRILFSSSWVTDGYFWSLEYLHQRLVDISDRILTSALTTGVLPEHFLRMKCHSMPNIDSIDQCQVLNEEPTNEIIEQRLAFLKINGSPRKSEQRFTSFYRKIRRIHYIDDENHHDGTDLNHHIDRYLLTNSRCLSSRTTDRSKSFSLSDNEIDYKCLETIEEAQGSRKYINRNGTMNFGVILAGLHAVICKDDHLKICETTMNILDVLFALSVISFSDENLQQTSNNDLWTRQINAKDNEKFQLALDIILRILKRLGCSLCQTQNRSFTVDQLRGKVRLALNRLHQINNQQFEQCFLNLIDRQDLNSILDIFHSLCSFCSVSNLGLNHYAPFITLKNEVEMKTMHFAEIDDRILKIILKPLVTRLNAMEKELNQPKNTTIYTDFRTFFSYVKQVHPGTFRSLIFSSLIDSQRKLKFEQKQNLFNEKSTRPFRTTIDENPFFISSLHREIERIHFQTKSLREDDSNIYVDLPLIRLGLLRFHFLLQSSPPGSIPDPQYLHNLLFLDAPIIAKAAFLLECSNFVRRCSLGQWPEWMKTTLNSSRFHSTLNARRNSENISKLNRSYQLAAIRMFYIWAEALSSQLEMILDGTMKSDDRNRFWNGDEIYQDYYQEAIVNPTGNECPYALQLIVCLLLFEITSFIRETFQTFPRLPSVTNSRPTKTPNPPPLLEVSSVVSGNETRPSSRLRMDSIISLISHRSAISSLSEHLTPSPKVSPNTTINVNSSIHERHISFGACRENDSNASNHTTILINENDEEHPTMIEMKTTKNVKSKLIRRGSAKIRKPSFRMKETSGVGGKNPHRPSFRTRRRSHVFNLSSDATTAPITSSFSANETTDESMISPEDFQDQNHFETMVNSRVFPWIKIVIRIFNRLDLRCEHKGKCSMNCYNKQTMSCQNLVDALTNLYRSSTIRTAIRRQNTMTSRRTQSDIRTNRCSMPLSDDSINEENENHPHFLSMINYLKKQVTSLISIPLMILCKSSVVLEDEHYSQILHLTWKLLLDRNEELSSSAATMIILMGTRAPHLIDRLFQDEMTNPSSLIRYESILRFQILWRFRSHFRMRLEDGAQMMIKILPPSIEFVLPSPLLGIANLQTVDPPWVSEVKTRVQQVALNQEEVKAVITASKSRQKHQQELIHSALLTEEISKRVAREHFTLSTVSILSAASYALLAHQSKDEDDDVYLDDDRLIETNLHVRQVQGTIPSAFNSAVFHLVDLLEDVGTIENGAAVSQAAEKTLWTCLIDEPTLIIRFFFEKLSQKERRKKSLGYLHRLMISFVDMPSQCAQTIFNYILGLIISMIRSPLDGAQDLILAGLTLIWQILPFLHGLVLKDLKQILRTEQAEMMILVTGNLPSAKRVIIHGPDASQIPTQAIIAEDTLFSNVLQEAIEFFGIPDAKRDQAFLIDVKTQQIHINETYVRDFYYFHRNIYPQLSLITINPKQAHSQLEHRAIFLKTTELSKVLFARHLLENTPFNQIYSSVTFFHNELMKSPLFPRKPLESDFNLDMKFFDKELFNLDMLHKYNWIKLISCIFFNMDGKTATMWDITLFINVINGSFVLHCEDLAMLRFCLATYINIAQHFHHIFATNGYSLIMPTILRVYSNIQSNPMVKKAIEYACRQFFILHRLPFILQTFGSISKLVDTDEQSDVADTNKIQPLSLFRLIFSFEQKNADEIKDEYALMELIRHESSPLFNSSNISRTEMLVMSTVRPGTVMAMRKIRSLDFCYADDENVLPFLHCLDLCVSVVAYAPDSIRSLQMLNIIDLLLPKYLEQIRNRMREEVKIIEKLSISMKTLINVLECLTRAFVEPKHDSTTNPMHRHGRSSSRSASVMVDEDSMSRFVDDRAKSRAQDADERKQASEFRAPRDTLLSIMSNFVDKTSKRLKELQKLANEPMLSRMELLDAKSYNCLAEIAHTLLKLSSFDPVTISSRGLQSYFQKLLPWIDWSQEQMRTALNLLLRRVDRMLVKICKKSIVKRCFNWEAVAGILRGIYSTVDRHPYIAHFPSFKALVSGCIALILNENLLDAEQNFPRLDTPTFPKEFPQSVIKLVGRYILSLKNQPNLESIVNLPNPLSNYSLTINHLLHFLLPLMFWSCSGRSDAPKFHSNDISYIVTILLSSIKPASKLASTMGTQPNSTTAKTILIANDNAVPGNSFTHKSMKQLKDLVQTASLFGLKLLIIAFAKQIKREWSRIVHAIKLMCQRQSQMPTNLLVFLDFLVSYPTPIYLLLRPFLLHHLNSFISENERDFELINNIHQKLLLERITPSKSIGTILHELRQELNQLKSRTNDESKGSIGLDYRPISADRVRFDPNLRDHDDWTMRTNTTSGEKRSTPSRTTPLPPNKGKITTDTTFNSLRKRKITKIRLKDSLEILENYHDRCQTQTNVLQDEKSVRWTRDSTFRSLSSIIDPMAIVLTSDTPRTRSPIVKVQWTSLNQIESGSAASIVDESTKYLSEPNRRFPMKISSHQREKLPQTSSASSIPLATLRSKQTAEIRAKRANLRRSRIAASMNNMTEDSPL